MFRLFIREKLRTARTASATKPKPGRRNRRITERYPVDFKRLTMMNEQDILQIRDISAKGFSTYVSTRGWERFNIGDIYGAKMRYLGELYEVEARVSWKSQKDVVGFELVNPDKQTLGFMARLLQPIRIANSLKEVDAKFMASKEDGKTWLHGDENTDLNLWHNNGGELTAWQLVSKNRAISWSINNGLQTSRIDNTGLDDGAILGLADREPQQDFDSSVDEKTRQNAIDIVMALGLNDRQQILATLTDDGTDTNTDKGTTEAQKA